MDAQGYLRTLKGLHTEHDFRILKVNAGIYEVVFLPFRQTVHRQVKYLLPQKFSIFLAQAFLNALASPHASDPVVQSKTRVIQIAQVGKQHGMYRQFLNHAVIQILHHQTFSPCN